MLKAGTYLPRLGIFVSSDINAYNSQGPESWARQTEVCSAVAEQDLSMAHGDVWLEAPRPQARRLWAALFPFSEVW